MPDKKLKPVHPGEVLREEFLIPMGISQYRLAQSISVPPRRINEIVHEKRSITADTALRLSRFFGVSERFWLNLQAQFDLETQKDKLGTKLVHDVIPRESAALGYRQPTSLVACRTPQADAKSRDGGSMNAVRGASRSRIARKAR